MKLAVQFLLFTITFSEYISENVSKDNVVCVSEDEVCISGYSLLQRCVLAKLTKGTKTDSNHHKWGSCIRPETKHYSLCIQIKNCIFYMHVRRLSLKICFCYCEDWSCFFCMQMLNVLRGRDGPVGPPGLKVCAPFIYIYYNHDTHRLTFSFFASLQDLDRHTKHGIGLCWSGDFKSISIELCHRNNTNYSSTLLWLKYPG